MKDYIVGSILLITVWVKDKFISYFTSLLSGLIDNESSINSIISILDQCIKLSTSVCILMVVFYRMKTKTKNDK